MMVSQASGQSLWRVCTAQMRLVWRSVLLTVFIKQTMGSYCTQKTCVSVVDIASMRVHSVHHSSRRRVTLGHEARWISAHSAPVVLKRTTRRQNSRSTEVTVLRKENCQLVPSSARPKLYWPVTVTMSQRFIASAS